MKLIGPLLLTAFILGTPALSTPAADESNQTNFQVVALMVVAPAGGTDNRNFCWKTGVTVSVLYAPTDGKIVDFDQNESKLVSFTDDKGTDLMAAPPSTDPFNKPGISGMLPQANGGASSIVFDLKASGQPAKGATSFNITGKASLEIAGGTNQITVENVAIKTNSVFSLGDLPLMISEAGTNKNVWGSKDYPYSVTFSSLRDMKNISSMEFFDAAGNKVAAEKRSWGGGPLGYMIQYDFKQLVDRARIVATCWKDLKTIELPIAVKATAGL